MALSSKVWTADGAVVWDDPDAARRDIYPSPVLADLTGDGVVDLVSGLGLLDGRTWTRVCTLGDGDGHVAIADLDLDGEPEIIATVFPTPWDGGQELVVANADCSVRWRTPVISAVGPTLADFDGDGAPEIALRADHGGTPNTDSHAVYDGDGTLLWARDDPTPPGGSSLLNYAPAFDFDRDGAAELIGAISGHLAVFDGRTGEIRLEAPDVPACGNGGVFPIDADGDGHAEIVSVASGCAAQITVVEQVDDQWPWATPVWNQYGYAITNVNLDGTLPEDPVPSWELYNSFRAGPTPRLGPNGELPHLVAHLAEVCTACADGVLTVTVEVGNRSVAPAVAPIGWVLEGEIGGTWTPLHRETHERGLQGGDWLTRRIEVPSAGVTGLRLRVDDDVDRVTECDHADHVEVWEGPLCGT